MAINVDFILNNIGSKYTPSTRKTNNTNGSNNSNASNNIFAQYANDIVSEYKAKQEEEKQNNKNTKKANAWGLSAFKMASMSTKEWLNYAYNNQPTGTTSTGDKQKNEKNISDNGDIDLPMIVMYAGKTVCTAGKSFMQVVAKIHAQYPFRSEEEIAAKLLQKYSSESAVMQAQQKRTQQNQTAGFSLNMSA